MRDCAVDSYHYCAENECQTCICMKCDGGRSVKAIYFSENGLLLESLLERGTTHFKIVDCLLEDPEDEAPAECPRNIRLCARTGRSAAATGPTAAARDAEVGSVHGVRINLFSVTVNVALGRGVRSVKWK